MLTRDAIYGAFNRDEIKIKPFKASQLNPNSYDLRLARTLFDVSSPRMCREMDVDSEVEYDEILIPDNGFVLEPGHLYLGVTKEWTYTNRYIPMIEGKSTTARYGITTHISAGFGDLSFSGHWTLEIAAVRPVRIYADMRIVQISYYAPTGMIDITNTYNKRGNYNVEYSEDPKPKLPVPGNLRKG